VAEGIEYLIRNLHDRVQTFGWETWFWLRDLALQKLSYLRQIQAR
jgi:hypothetical protein